MDNLKSLTPDHRNLKSLASLSYTPNSQETVFFRKATLPNLSTIHKKSLSDINYKILLNQPEIQENVEIYKKKAPKPQIKSIPREIRDLNLRKLAVSSPHESILSSVRLRGSDTTKSNIFDLGVPQTERPRRGKFPLLMNTTRGSNADYNDLGYVKQEEYIKSNPHFKKFNRSLHLIDRKEAIKIGFSREFFWSEFQVEYNKQHSNKFRGSDNSKTSSQIKGLS